MSEIHDCRTRTDGVYNPWMIGRVNDVEDLAARAIDFAPCVWLNPLFYSGNDFGAVSSESAFAIGDSDGREFPYTSTTGDPPISSTDAERLQYQDISNDSDYAEFSGLWNSNAYKTLEEGGLPMIMSQKLEN